MPFTISQFNRAIADAARPNQFTISFTPPSGVTIPNAGILCKSAAIPGLTIGVIEVPLQGGRRMKLPGDRTFAEWTATFIADQSHGLRSGFEKWMAGIVNFNFNTAAKASGQITGDYKQNIVIQQLNSNGSPVTGGTYTLKDAFPTDISQIDLSYDTTDTIEEFTVTFQYTYYS